MSPTGIAYLTGEYPRTTDTFIQREVAELRELGVRIDTFSVRRTSDPTVTSRLQEQALDTTTFLLPAGLAAVATAHLELLRKSPRRYYDSVALALKTRRPGLKGLAYQAAYFAEGGLLAKQLHERKLAHLHNHFEDSSCSVAMVAASLAGCTYSFSMHGSSVFYAAHTWQLGTKIERAAFVACVSWFTRSQGALFAAEPSWGRMHVVHCGIDPSNYQVKQHTGTGTIAVFVARLAPGKGIEVVLESVPAICKRIPGFVLRIVGDGPSRQAIQTAIAERGLGDAVEMLGNLSPAAVAEQLHEADVFVLASFAEGVPTVIMEAMGCGLPVVATNVGGVAEIVHDGSNGFLIRPGDHSAVSEAMTKLLEDADLRNRFGAVGRKLVESEFRVSDEAERLRDLFAFYQPSSCPPSPPMKAAIPPPVRPDL